MLDKNSILMQLLEELDEVLDTSVMDRRVPKPDVEELDVEMCGPEMDGDKDPLGMRLASVSKGRKPVEDEEDDES